MIITLYAQRPLARTGKAIALVAVLGCPAVAHAQTWGQNGVNIRQVDPSLAVNFIHPISNSGQVVGTSGGFAAIYESLTGITRRVGDPAATTSSGYGINNVGQAVGVNGSSVNGRAFISDGVMNQSLGTLGGVKSLGYAANDAGEIVGLSTLSDRSTHAYRYSGGVMEDLGTLGGVSSSAYAINASGVAVGSSMYTGTSLMHAFVTTATGIKDLGTLGGPSSFAYGINASGVIVGYSNIANGTLHAFVSDGSSMSDLGTLGGSRAEAYGVSEAGYITGRAVGVSGVFKAAIWEANGGGYLSYALEDIANAESGSTGWSFTFTEGISDDSRFVLAQGQNTISGTSGFYVLEAAAPAVTPTPEPLSLSLLAIGLLGIAPVVTKRKTRHPA